MILVAPNPILHEAVGRVAPNPVNSITESKYAPISIREQYAPST